MHSKTTMLVEAIYGLSACIVLSLCIFVLDGSLFSWHPFFMSLGFLSFMTMGVVRSVTFRLLDGKARTKAIQVHAVLQILALSCALAGLAAIVQNKVSWKLRHDCSHICCGHSLAAQTCDAVICTGAPQQAASEKSPC